MSAGTRLRSPRGDLRARIEAYTDRTGVCHIWTGARTQAGYGKITLPSGRSGGRTMLPHRVVYELAYGAIPAGMHVMHRCDVPLCVRLDHLQLGTAADNIADKVRKGRQAFGARHGSRTHPELIRRGEQHHNARLTASVVVELRTRVASGETCVAVARDLRISVHAAYLAVQRRSWRHL